MDQNTIEILNLTAMLRENEGMSSAAYGVGDWLAGAAYAEAADEQRKRLIKLLANEPKV